MKHLQSFITLLNSQTIKTQLAIAAVCMLIGILIATQLRAQQTASSALKAATETDLTEIVSNLNGEVSMLRAEAADLRLQLFKTERQSSSSRETLEDSFKNLNNLRIIAGVTKVRGSGIKVLVTDEQNSLNSYDLIDIVNELRIGGAEAISINGIRVVASTGIEQGQDAIFIDQKNIAQPYEVLAIGEPELLNDALVIAGGIRDKLTSLEGVSFYLTKEADITINSGVAKGTK